MRYTICIYICFICVYCKYSNGQIVHRGKCKDSPVQDNFNITKFAGTWHETSRSFTFFELLMRCVRTEYNISGQGKIDIKIHGVDAIGASRSFQGKAELKDATQPAKFKAKFRILPMSINYDILKTDYDNYAIIWSCNNMFGGRLGHTEQLWIMSRKPMLDDYVKSQLYDFLDKHNIRRRFLEGNARQEKCFQPEVPETAEVIPIAANTTILADGNTTVLPDNNTTLSSI